MTIKMKAPEGVASISIDDKNFIVNGGFLIIPHEFMSKALEHGFSTVDDLEIEKVNEPLINSEKKYQKSNKKG